ncbi:glucosamine-6-phosphate deaminase [Alicyclobacillus mengziensis]|uniref:Glucosamine-6-phosphate deaminase n=1 Tax=Alicyclobacillus mengziensis TaxID=2931921 RepID=A0A9X7VXW5_9BACL|nr:glucosamine-6-phosphate deaminase [Alicyclobacillus mengziensis]QSO47049.1 glucosamine-6-phosphate deaminase [Alicyclobacillus mengziensis]
MRIRVFESPKDAGIYVATLMEQVILHVERPVLGLATGSTVIPCYQAFRSLADCGLDLSRTVTINLDEYVGLSADHAQSYHYFMRENLFQHLPTKPEESHVPNGVAANLEEECKRYDALIQSHPIDLQLLGIGVNGHIGFNEPSHSLLSRTHVVSLSEETIQSNARFFDTVKNVPHQAVTMGVQAILQAKQIVLVAFGKNKAKAVAESVSGSVQTNVPASMLQLHRDVTWVLDKESASLLPGELWPH